MEEYGPQTRAVEAVLATIPLLDTDRIRLIADAYREHKYPHGRQAWAAAAFAERRAEVARAVHDMRLDIQVQSITAGWDNYELEQATWAAQNVALAMATEDLIGQVTRSRSTAAW